MSETIAPRELIGYKLFAYCIGNFGFYLTLIFVSVFSFQFYVYTCNLDSLLVSIGVSVQFIIAAISAIIFGVMGDNKKPGKLGKRRPFMIVGLPVWFLTCILIWFPPWYAPQENSFYWPTAIYFWIMIIIRSISGTCISVSLISMLPELSQTFKNREKVASIGTLLQIFASIISMMLPMIIQSMLEDPINAKWWQPSGQVVIFWAPLIGTILAFVGLVSYMITIFSLDESFHKLDTEVDSKRKSIKDTFAQMFKPAKDKNFRKQLTVEFCNRGAGRILGILIIPLMTYVLLFKQSDFLIYSVVSIFGKFGGYILFRNINKKKGLLTSYKACILFAVVSASADLLFLIDIFSFEIKMIIFIITIGTILGAMYGFGLFTGPLTSALIEQAAVKMESVNGNNAISKLSGSYFGLLTFLSSVGTSVASFIMGLVLTGANNENPVIITISFASIGLIYMVGFLSLNRLKINLENDSQE